ncbi:MAG: ATP-binding protein [Siphonobacter sp.]
MHLGLLEVDRDDRIIRAYDRFCEMVGYSQEELIGQVASEFLIPHEYHYLLNKQNAERATGKVGSYEIPIRCKNGNILWVIISGAPIFNENGQVVGSIGIHYDDSERQKLLDDLAKAKQLAEDAQSAEKQFLANMSHEIRTPLNAIVGMAHLLYDTRPSEEQKEYLDILKSSANFLHNLLSDVLEMSVIEAGELKIKKEEFDLIGLLVTLQKTYQLKNTAVEIQLETDQALEGTFIGDATALQQIMTNLLSNAEKFTEKGVIAITAKLLEKEKNTQWVEFQVSDTGVGIDKDKLSLIFTKFKQIDNSIGQKTKGTGLGLALVKQLVELQGGNITVKSEKGVGSHFIFTFPFQLSHTELVNKKDSFEQALPQVKEHKILVVEDNLMNRKYISSLLDKWHIEYRLAVDGREALEFANHELFDLILMDLQMPFMDGYETTLSIRNTHNPNQHTVIIALSASAMEDQRVRSFEVGMTDFLAKPFTPAHLQETLEKYLTNSDRLIDTFQNNYHMALDHAYLWELYADDYSYALEMFSTFLRNLLPDYKNLIPLAEQDDWDGVAKLVHKLNPPLAMVGLTDLQKLLKSIEFQITEENDSTGIMDKLVLFEKELMVKTSILSIEVQRLVQKTANT